ncbi:uncharacterized protein [Battus philenor]|uniref:uncharacterized protein n=1 Tax=Battus philenor TaxID=42288 RepID=UPI0035D1398A
MEETKRKCCFVIDLKTVCFILGYFQLILYVAGTVTSTCLMINLVMVFPFDDPTPKMIQSLVGTLMIGLMALPLGILISKFTITLLVGLHTNNRVRIVTYLIFATIMLLVMIASTIILSFSISFATLIIGLNALSIYVVRKYYKQLDTVDEKLIKETV